MGRVAPRLPDWRRSADNQAEIARRKLPDAALLRAEHARTARDLSDLPEHRARMVRALLQAVQKSDGPPGISIDLPDRVIRILADEALAAGYEIQFRNGYLAVRWDTGESPGPPPPPPPPPMRDDPPASFLDVLRSLFRRRPPAPPPLLPPAIDVAGGRAIPVRPPHEPGEKR